MSTNDVIKTETKKKEKCIHVDGRSSRYFSNEQLFWYIYYALDDETRDDEMVN
jgi:hypothetical protein